MAQAPRRARRTDGIRLVVLVLEPDQRQRACLDLAGHAPVDERVLTAMRDPYFARCDLGERVAEERGVGAQQLDDARLVVQGDDLVEAPPTGDPRTTFRPVRRGGMTLVPLTRRAGGLQAFKMVLPGGAPAVLPERQTHEGFEWMYVLSGRLRLLLGEHDVVLVPGEVAEFDTRTPHWFGNPGPGVAELLSLLGPQGERMHVRARPKQG